MQQQYQDFEQNNDGTYQSYNAQKLHPKPRSISRTVINMVWVLAIIIGCVALVFILIPNPALSEIGQRFFLGSLITFVTTGIILSVWKKNS